MNVKALILAALSAPVLFSCNKEMSPASADSREIVFIAEGDGIGVDVETKTTALAAVPSSLYLERTTGTWKSETAKDASASKTVSTGAIATGWYQTVPATAYNYYVSNKQITFAAGGSTIAPTNDTDVIAGCTQAATTSTTPSATMEHVYARTGSLTCNTQSGYSISGVSWKIQSNSGGGTTGTYNIATKAWSGVTALSETAFTSSSDLYLVPGSYKITVTYTLTLGAYSETFTKSGNVTLTAGKINNISCTAIGGNAQSISLTVSLTAWSSQSVTLTFS